MLVGDAFFYFGIDRDYKKYRYYFIPINVWEKSFVEASNNPGALRIFRSAYGAWYGLLITDNLWCILLILLIVLFHLSYFTFSDIINTGYIYSYFAWKLKFDIHHSGKWITCMLKGL